MIQVYTGHKQTQEEEEQQHDSFDLRLIFCPF